MHNFSYRIEHNLTTSLVSSTPWCSLMKTKPTAVWVIWRNCNTAVIQEAIHSRSTDYLKHWYTDLQIWIGKKQKWKDANFCALFNQTFHHLILYADPYSIFAVVWALVCLSICFKTKFYQHNIHQESWQLKYAEKVKPRIMFNVVFNIYSVNGRH